MSTPRPLPALRSRRHHRHGGCRTIPASSASSRCTTCSPPATRGELFPVGREPGQALGRPVLGSIDEVPDGAADLLFVCTPQAVNEDLLRAAATKGVRAAFFAAAGYREAGGEGAEAERRLVALADELGVVLAGPNGQGVVSTPSSMCAQIVAPYAPAGRIGIASQSGNFVSSFLNMAHHTGVGVSRAVAAGNAASLGIVEYLEYFADDPATDVSLVYMESVDNGRAMFDSLRRLSERQPIVVVKGGASDAGASAAASHTGALAADDVVFDGMARQAGLIRARDVEEAFEAAATLATQPLPAGDRVVVVTTVGGWGVAAVDAMASTRLDPVALPDDLPSHDRRDAPRPGGVGATRSTWPEARTPRHSAGSTRAGCRAPRCRRGGVPGHRYPVEHRGDDAVGTVLPRPRSRADRRLPRAPGHPLRRGPRPTSPPARARPSWSPPSWRTPVPTTPARQPCGRPAVSATLRPVGPCAPSTCSPATPTGDVAEGSDRG